MWIGVFAVLATMIAPAPESDLASAACLYDSLTRAERDAIQGPEIRDAAISQAAHGAARAKLGEIVGACGKKWRWTKEDFEAALVYMTIRSAAETTQTQLATRGVTPATVGAVAGRLSAEQRAQLLRGELSEQLGTAIAKIAYDYPSVRKVLSDDSKVPSSARLLGRAVGGRVFLDSLSAGKITFDDLRRLGARSQ